MGVSHHRNTVGKKKLAALIEKVAAGEELRNNNQIIGVATQGMIVGDEDCTTTPCWPVLGMLSPVTSALGLSPALRRDWGGVRGETEARRMPD